jgi:trans-aconitate methyltransferase
MSLPYIKKYFPKSRIVATDISARSMEYVASHHADITVLPDQALRENTYDLIFANVVFHHIPPEVRSQVIHRLSSLLRDKGRLVVFEHNPYNPVTRHMVSICPYDEDAILIPLNGMKKLVDVQENLKVDKYGYCLFFPKALVFLRDFEKYLRWLPLGGQYFFVAQKVR